MYEVLIICCVFFKVQQVEQGIRNLTTGNIYNLFPFYIFLNFYFIFIKTIKTLGKNVPQVPIGRGAVRGRRQMEYEHYRTPRPQSSLGAIGKQGKV